MALDSFACHHRCAWGFPPGGGGISQPSILLTCFNSAGGANAGLRKSLRVMSHYPFLGENFVLTNLGPRILDRSAHEGKTFLWKTILSSKTVS